MKTSSRDWDERRFQAAWARFVDADTRVTAPDDLEERVHHAVGRAIQRRRAQPVPSRVRVWIAASAAAALLLFALAIDLRMRPDVDPRMTEAVRGHTAAGSSRARPAPTNESERTTRDRSAAWVDAEPVPDNEVLHLVRVRIPVAALQAAGVALDQPEDTDADVDVDMIVGDDGFPREIRSVQPVTSNGT